MVLRPDRHRFWRNWRKRLPRLVVVFAGAIMVTLLLLAIDWSPLERFHLGWLVTIAAVLLWVLWLGLTLVMASLGLVAVALRVDRIEIDGTSVRRYLVLGRRITVPIESATVSRSARSDVVIGGGKRLVVPHVFYSPDDIDRLWAAGGLTGSSTSA